MFTTGNHPPGPIQDNIPKLGSLTGHASMSLFVFSHHRSKLPVSSTLFKHCEKFSESSYSDSVPTAFNMK